MPREEEPDSGPAGHQDEPEAAGTSTSQAEGSRQGGESASSSASGRGEPSHPAPEEQPAVAVPSRIIAHLERQLGISFDGSLEKQMAGHVVNIVPVPIGQPMSEELRSQVVMYLPQVMNQAWVLTARPLDPTTGLPFPTRPPPRPAAAAAAAAATGEEASSSSNRSRAGSSSTLEAASSSSSTTTSPAPSPAPSTTPSTDSSLATSMASSGTANTATSSTASTAEVAAPAVPANHMVGFHHVWGYIGLPHGAVQGADPAAGALEDLQEEQWPLSLSEDEDDDDADTDSDASSDFEDENMAEWRAEHRKVCLAPTPSPPVTEDEDEEGGEDEHKDGDEGKEDEDKEKGQGEDNHEGDEDDGKHAAEGDEEDNTGGEERCENGNKGEEEMQSVEWNVEDEEYDLAQDIEDEYEDSEDECEMEHDCLFQEDYLSGDEFEDENNNEKHLFARVRETGNETDCQQASHLLMRARYDARAWNMHWDERQALLQPRKPHRHLRELMAISAGRAGRGRCHLMPCPIPTPPRFPPAPAVDHSARLPDELMLLIFNWVDEPRFLCMTLARVCRRWARLALDRKLWARADLHWREPHYLHLLAAAPAIRCLTVHGHHSFEPLLKCTRAVQELVVQGNSTQGSPFKVTFDLPAVLRHLGSQLTRLAMDLFVCQDDMEAIEGLPHLKELQLSQNWPPRFDLVDPAWLSVVTRPNTIQALIYNKSTTGQQHTHHVAPYMVLRSCKTLRRLSGSLGDFDMSAFRKCSRLEQLSLSLPNFCGIKNLDHCKRLNMLVLDCYNYAQVDEEVPPMSLRSEQRLAWLALSTRIATLHPAALVSLLRRYRCSVKWLVVGQRTRQEEDLMNAEYMAEAMDIIGRMDNLRGLSLLTPGWPALPNPTHTPPWSPRPHIQQLRWITASFYDEWLYSCLLYHRNTLRRVYVTSRVPMEQPMLTVLSQCRELRHACLPLNAIVALLHTRKLSRLVLNCPEVCTAETLLPLVYNPVVPEVFGRLTELQLITSNLAEQILDIIAPLCTQVRLLRLQQGGDAEEHNLNATDWTLGFEKLVALSLNLTNQVPYDILAHIAAGRFPTMKRLLIESLESKIAISSAVDEVRRRRPHLKVKLGWQEANLVDDDTVNCPFFNLRDYNPVRYNW